MNNPNARHQLDLLFAVDAVVSIIFGILAILAPHGFMAKIGGGSYNHSVHETLRYGMQCDFVSWIFLLIIVPMIFSDTVSFIMLGTVLFYAKLSKNVIILHYYYYY